MARQEEELEVEEVYERKYPGWEYVRGSWRNTGYFRRRPYDRDHPGESKRITRFLFGKIAHEKGRVSGKVKTRDGKEIPRSAAVIQKHLKGIRVAPPKPKLPAPLLHQLDELSKTFRSLKAINKILRELRIE